ncbi:MAG: glutathione S-transferase family protein [Caldimonas sp.]
MTFSFYYAPGTCALASHIVLEQAGASYTAIRLDFPASQQTKPEYLAINPKGRVPALVTDRGVLTETPAVLVFLAQTFPQAELAPLNDPFALAELQSVNSYLCSTVHVAHAHRRRAYRWADDPAAQQAIQAKVAQNMSDCFSWIEREVLRGPWVMGSGYTVADPYLFTLASWLKGDGVDITQFPRVAEHSERIRQLPAVRRVLPLHGMAL